MASSLEYPFDWEAHAVEEERKRAQEAADLESMEAATFDRHPIDKKLFPVIDTRAPRNGPYVAFQWDSTLTIEQVADYLEQYWSTRAMVDDGIIWVHLGVEHADLRMWDYMVLSTRSGFPIPRGEFIKRFVRKTEDE
jgi:hypothetical protein